MSLTRIIIAGTIGVVVGTAATAYAFSSQRDLDKAALEGNLQLARQQNAQLLDENGRLEAAIGSAYDVTVCTNPKNEIVYLILDSPLPEKNRRVSRISEGRVETTELAVGQLLEIGPAQEFACYKVD